MCYLKLENSFLNLNFDTSICYLGMKKFSMLLRISLYNTSQSSDVTCEKPMESLKRKGHVIKRRQWLYF